ncbi:hypothetical protein CA54_08740 [Symmachiella macrocystis]|uniref:Uncharacterized protein n=2 Tax=Symmachiella macrocystis TaxID=2527985 RepID=A0A5C6BJ31_9PLAN|nr:hypothetical protein CA54_08740 [Symmachiella macrocystis]
MGRYGTRNATGLGVGVTTGGTKSSTFAFRRLADMIDLCAQCPYAVRDMLAFVTPLSQNQSLP